MRNRLPGLGPALTIAAIAVGLVLLAGCEWPGSDTNINLHNDNRNGQPPACLGVGSGCATSADCCQGTACDAKEHRCLPYVAPTPTPTPTPR